ncbi:hypothetical protein AB0G35_37035 [Streptomyces sp. NPDC021749]|uniref:hypothetical protein n=1 Tax=Streptomyces sp. NPDC021749 TaxID=3154905 RepID=UPI003409B4DA
MSTIVIIAAVSSGLTEVQEKLVVGLASAFVGVFGTLLVHFLASRQKPRKRVSWDSVTEPGLGSIDPQLGAKLRISYNGNHVNHLYSARYRLTNSGNTVIKNQRVRFEIPAGVKVLELAPAPQPEPELEVERSPESSGSRIVYTIGQLERGEEVGFSLVLDGHSAPQWRAKTSNAEGGVDVQKRDSQRNVEDRAHVIPFLASVFFLLAIPPVVSGLVFYGKLGGVLASVVRIAFLLFSLLHLFPTLRLLRDIYFSGKGKGTTIDGDALFFNGSIHGGVAGKVVEIAREQDGASPSSE